MLNNTPVSVTHGTQRNIIFSFIVFIALFLFALSPNVHAEANKIVIVIDDIGYNRHDINAVNLPYPVTLSVLPNAPHAKAYADKAVESGKDILLHIPMASLSGKKLGPAALTTNMSREDIETSLEASLSQFPYAIGINNHMGSLLTQMTTPMRWTMHFLKNHDLCFLDSRTTRFSKAELTAREAGVHVLRRHVFIDNLRSPAYLQQQFDHLVAKAKRLGIAVGIAHPHPETITFLSQALATLPEQQIELVPISQALGEGYEAIGFAQAARIARSNQSLVE